MAYGFRDSDYFFMKIKAAFPGKCDEPFSLPVVQAATRRPGRQLASSKPLKINAAPAQ